MELGCRSYLCSTEKGDAGDRSWWSWYRCRQGRIRFRGREERSDPQAIAVISAIKCRDLPGTVCKEEIVPTARAVAKGEISRGSSDCFEMYFHALCFVVRKLRSMQTSACLKDFIRVAFEILIS
jgi:hypothetical protein